MDPKETEIPEIKEVSCIMSAIFAIYFFSNSRDTFIVHLPCKLA